MGKPRRGELRRGLVMLAVSVGLLLPVTRVTAAPPTPPADRAAVRVAPTEFESEPRPERRFVDEGAKVSLVPPAGWRRGPDTALNPPGEPVFEIARFQLRLGDPGLYAQPVPLTSGLVLDAKAVLSIGLARADSDIVRLALATKAERAEAARIPGFAAIDEEAVYEGLHTLTRYYVARGSSRRIVVRAAASVEDWPTVATPVRAAIASLRADPRGANGPAAPPPPPPAPAPVTAPAPAPAPARAAAIDSSPARRGEILARAALMLGTPYLWGGNVIGRAMDCSAFVSAAWSTDRYTTDSIWAVSHRIGKDELLPGDAMNLTIGNDPRRRGHIRIFEAWANEARTLMWVYEETPPRAVHRVIAYDARYQPIRLAGLSGTGVAPLVAALPSQVQAAERAVAFVPPPARSLRRAPTLRPATPRPTAKPKPTVRPTARVTVRATVPSGSGSPAATAPRAVGSTAPTIRPVSVSGGGTPPPVPPSGPPRPTPTGSASPSARVTTP